MYPGCTPNPSFYFFKLFSSVAFISSTLLIVLRVCVSHDLFPEARHSRNLGRIAIWNKANIIFAIAMAIWLTENSLFLLGEYLQRIMGEFLVYLVIS